MPPRKKPSKPAVPGVTEAEETKRFKQLLIERDRRELSKDFHAFFTDAWENVIESHTQFDDSWHYELLCEYAQLIGTGEFKKLYPDKKGLIVCIPPRSLKSKIFSVALNAWIWTHSPWKKFLCLSYSETLAEQMSKECRDLIQSAWYRKRWKMTLKDDSNEKRLYATQDKGYRFSSGVQATGWGGNIIICDDLLNAKDAYAKKRREKVNQFWDDALTTRRNNPAEDVYLVVMQRLNAGDLVGYLTAREKEEWVFVEVQAEADADTDYVFPISGRVHHRRKGDVLTPVRFTDQYIKGEKKNVKKWNSQFQQRPSPPGGFIFNPDEWRFYDIVATDGRKDFKLPDPDFQVLSVDCAWKSGKDNDKVALMVIGVEGAKRFVLDWQHEHMSYNGILDAIRAMRKKYPKISYVLVEQAANGEAVIKQLSEEMGGMVGIVPRDDKESRAHAASADLKNSYLPNPDQETRTQTEIVDDFARFPETIEFDDLIDAFTQGINWLRARYWGTEHLDKAYEEVLKGKGNSDPKAGEACPGCTKTGTIVREGSGWICRSCGSSGRGNRRKLIKVGM